MYGASVGYYTIMKSVDAAGVMIRAGASCNPGGLSYLNVKLDILIEAMN